MSTSVSQRPVVLYLPGLDGTGRLLYRQVGLFRDYRVLCESYPQDRPQTYESLAATAARHLEDASAGQPGIVLAESFGGGVALTLALMRPELIERMVLVNTFAHYPDRVRISLIAWLSKFLPSGPVHAASRRLRASFFFSSELTAKDLDAFWERTADVPMSAMGVRLRMIRELDLRARLGEITVPTLVLTSRDDGIVPPAAGRELARRLPCARLFKIRAAHAALIHPRIDVARFLCDPQYWEGF